MTVTSSELFCKNLDPYYAVATGFKGEITLWMSLVTVGIVVLLGLVIDRFWCKYVCPLGAVSNTFKFWAWLLVLALLCAVLLVFFGLFAKKMRGPVVLAILGAASAYGMNIAFNSLAKPLLKGTVSVTDILGQELITGLTGGVSVLGDILSAFTGGTSQLVNIKLFALGGAYVFMILLFVAVIVWTIFYAFADWDKQ